MMQEEIWADHTTESDSRFIEVLPYTSSWIYSYISSHGIDDDTGWEDIVQWLLCPVFKSNFSQFVSHLNCCITGLKHIIRRVALSKSGFWRERRIQGKSRRAGDSTHRNASCHY